MGEFGIIKLRDLLHVLPERAYNVFDVNDPTCIEKCECGQHYVREGLDLSAILDAEVIKVDFGKNNISYVITVNNDDGYVR